MAINPDKNVCFYGESDDDKYIAIDLKNNQILLCQKNKPFMNIIYNGNRWVLNDGRVY